MGEITAKTTETLHPQQTLGLSLAVGSYLIWGLYPFYWVLLLTAPVFEVLAHRMIWSLVFLVLVLPFVGGIKPLLALRHDRPKLIKLLCCAVVIAINWSAYIYSVAIDEVIQASLGYYMSPLMSAFMAMIFLGERLRGLQYLSMGLIVVGIGASLLIYQELHWISIVLAVTFAIYSTLRRQIKIPAVQALVVEVMPAALLGVLYVYSLGGGELIQSDLTTWALIVCMGPVTVIPLMLYGFAVNRAPLVPVALLFYIVPSCLLVISVGYFHEPLNASDVIVFVFVWIGLGLYGLESLRKNRIRH